MTIIQRVLLAAAFFIIVYFSIVKGNACSQIERVGDGAFLSVEK